MGMVKLTGDWEIDVVKNPAPRYYGYLFPFSLTIHDARMGKKLELAVSPGCTSQTQHSH